MNKSSFSPGFCISLVDVVILIVGFIGSISLGYLAWWAGFIFGFVIIHFFLFCNVFRIPQILELIWACAFFVFASATILTGTPGWIATFISSMILSAFLIWKAVKRADYHGICWRTWNPGLKDWWESKHGVKEAQR